MRSHTKNAISLLLIAILPLIAVAALPIATPTATADVAKNTLHITLLGDSYSAGTGAGDYYDDKVYYRSRNNWAHKYVDWINTQGTPAILTNFAANGAVTEDLSKDGEGQIANISEDTDVVMFTIGGNDVHFSDIVKQCFTLGLRDATTCKQKVDDANSGLEGVRTNTEEILQRIDDKLPDGAQVILVGYPRLATDNEYILKDSDTVYDAGAGVRGLSDSARTVQSELVSNWNAAHPGLKVTYIDGVIDAFNGHEPDPSVRNRNDYRWLNEFFETEGVQGEDGKTTSKASKDTSVFYHPNLIGHAQIAELIQQKVGIPNSVRPQDLQGTIDIVFVVDSTGSMQDDAAAARNNIRSIMEQTSKRSSSYRFALVDYKDHPQFNPNNYLARTDVDFTTDPAAIERGFDSLTFEGGNLFNSHATVYSGTMQALGLTWRDGAKKIALVIGDAPPRDPEPGTGYTAESVAKTAYDIDPVSVHGINTSGSLNSPEFQSLVSRSGGTITDAASPDDVTGLINQAIDAELNKPFAWIQGPYVTKAGETIEIDAAASHAVKGELTKIEWDFNGDGTYEETSTSTRVQHTFTEVYSGVIGLRVTQTDGQTATATTRVDVTDDGDITPRESDNCPDVNNYGQSDYDGDGIGDDCDADPGFPTQDLPGVCVVGETCSNSPSNTPPSTTPAPSPSADPPSGSAPATPTGAGSSPAQGQSGDRAAGAETALLTQTGPAWPASKPSMT